MVILFIEHELQDLWEVEILDGMGLPEQCFERVRPFLQVQDHSNLGEVVTKAHWDQRLTPKRPLLSLALFSHRDQPFEGPM